MSSSTSFLQGAKADREWIHFDSNIELKVSQHPCLNSKMKEEVYNRLTYGDILKMFAEAHNNSSIPYEFLHPAINLYTFARTPEERVVDVIFHRAIRETYPPQKGQHS